MDWSTAIGVHIRRTDHKKAIEYSTLDKFLELLRKDSTVQYVVATDDQEVRQRLVEEFGDRCLFPALVLSRKTEEGMIQGVADFFALSKCHQIWGSYASSFSELAARYGSCELTIV